MSDRADYLGPTYKLGPPSPPPPTRGEVWKGRIRGLLFPPRPELGAFLFAAALGALGAYGLWFSFTLPGRFPSRIDWRAAAALVARDAQPGDAVALSPPWAERAREVLPERLPLRPDLPLPILAFPSYAAEDLPGIRRVWLVSLPRAPGAASRIARELADRSSSVDGPQPLGGIEVTRYELREPERPLYVFPEQLASASVQVGDSACAPDARGGVRCPGRGAPVVARETREIDFLPRTCIRVSPSGDPGRPLTLVFPDVPLGRTLRGHAGIAGSAGLGSAVPVRLRVSVNGEGLGEWEEAPRASGWRRFELDTSKYAGRRLQVSFEVTAAKAPRFAFCFDAATLP